MFTYIQNHTQLTESMLNEYRNSMIFLGDQKQIYVPVINTYVGLGQDAYTYILNKFDKADDNLNDLYDHINHNHVTSIYAQYSPTELNTYIQSKAGSGFNLSYLDGTTQSNNYVASNNYTYILQANRNVVVKGLTYNDTVNPYQYSSGINVTIKHQGGKHVTGTTSDGKYTYSYWDPEHDVIMIDDSYTWTYINERNSYMTNWVANFASTQANRIYENLLGTNTDTTVYIEKELEEAILFDENSATPIGNIYIRRRDTNADGYIYQKIYIHDNKVYVYNDKGNHNTNDFNSLWDSGTNPVPGTLTEIYDLSNRTINAQNINTLATEENGGIELVALDTYDPIWYQGVSATSGQQNFNLNDGIQTIKEVAYILDKITGPINDQEVDQTGIELAYNIAYNYVEIQKLKSWQADIGKSAVRSFSADSNNNYISADYYSKDLSGDGDNGTGDVGSTGNVNLDISLLVAQTYTLSGSTYAAYLAQHNNVINNKYLYKIVNDKTNDDNWISVGSVVGSTGDFTSNTDIVNSILDYFKSNGCQTAAQLKAAFNAYTFLVAPQKQGNTSTVLGSNLKNNGGNYIYWPYKKILIGGVEADATKGLTTVEWVTTYVKWGLDAINNRIDTIDVSGDISNFIETLYAYSGDAYGHGSEYSDESESGLFVTYVTEHNGIVEVHKNKLPLDKIITNGINSSEDILVPLAVDEFIQNSALYSDQGTYPNIYYINNSGQLTQFNGTNVNDAKNYNSLYYKQGSLNQFTTVNANTPVNDLIANLGKVAYFYKETNNNITRYVPLDVQTTYTNNTNSLYNKSTGKVATANKIYFLSSQYATNKYFSATTYQNVDGSTTTKFTAYISYLASSSATSTGLADAWDVRRTMESMFTWVNVKTNEIII